MCKELHDGDFLTRLTFEFLETAIWKLKFNICKIFLIVQIENLYRSFTTDREREVICRSLQKTEEWLYEDEIVETENFYTKKMKYLHKVNFIMSESFMYYQDLHSDFSRMESNL